MCNFGLLRLLERLQLGFRTDHEVVVIAQARTAGNQMTADNVLLEVFQRIDLGLDGRFVETLVVSWNEAAEMKLEVCKAARVIPCSTCVEVAGTISRTCTGFMSRRLRLEFSSRSLRSETIWPGCSESTRLHR